MVSALSQWHQPKEMFDNANLEVCETNEEAEEFKTCHEIDSTF